jgi:elongation factor G
MKTYETNQLKNIALLGNSGAGKTSLAESMLFVGGVIERKGDTNAKNTVSDYNQIEQENGISIFSSILYTEINNKKINILDNPGLDDFVGGVTSSLTVTDTAIMTINAQNGVEVGTEIQMRHAASRKKPVVFAINQLDHEKANFDKSVESLKERYGGNVTIVQYPVNPGEGFNSIIDLITWKMYTFKDASGKAELSDIPEPEMERAAELRNELIEKAAENDEPLMEIFFEKETLTEDEMRKGIKLGLIQRGLFPVFCTSAKQNMGVSRLLEFISNVVPAPDEMPAWKTLSGKEVKISANGDASLFVFKTSVESHIGEVNFFKVISGNIAEGIDMVNTTTQNKERLSQLYVSAGKNRIKVAKLAAGDLGATVKLKGTKTNHTLASGSLASEKFVAIDFPEPKFRTAVKTKAEGEEEKLAEALNRMHQEDPTILIEFSKELKQIIVSGQGEYHLNILKWYLENVFKVEIEYIAPKIPYRETITKVAQSSYRHKKQSGGAGQFGEVHMVIEPYVEGAPVPTTYKINGQDMKINVRDTDEQKLPWGGKLVYHNCIVGGVIDARFMPAILKGIMEKIEDGPLTGSYARDIRVSVYDGKMHPVDSNEISFKLAGRNAFREAFKNAGPKIMEPVYDVEVMVPSDRMGDVMSDLTGRRGVVMGMSSESGFEKIKARVPLAEMNKYSTTLSSLTNGRAMYSMKFAEYQQVPMDIQEQLLKAYKEEEDEE